MHRLVGIVSNSIYNLKLYLVLRVACRSGYQAEMQNTPRVRVLDECDFAYFEICEQK